MNNVVKDFYVTPVKLVLSLVVNTFSPHYNISYCLPNYNIIIGYTFSAPIKELNASRFSKFIQTAIVSDITENAA